ncbi:developmental regulator medusa [Coprinopsis cinerea okayama7|uniref:Developmental regulator medusa n=1 Tax=Coprinopsis cinerea (strain Okayama-7 / 130 / ATCC MYA-4618 / FGSC 9003) TaxID=240176 RepID=A8N6N3_COPC7|nr:developmental regulator medusa [Coprinopsis cinerea okayama7\|eukprot:XP_001830489.1 developmental regulator medusa [Coprinopsis cinerea okayama7\
MDSTLPVPVIPDAAPSNVVVSPTGIIHVLGYTPTEGERGVPITVRIHFHPELADAMYVRLVIGHKAVATKVRELPGTTYGRWQLDAIAPPFDKDLYSSPKVLISVQALNDENAVLDSVAFGEFSYWSPGCTADSNNNSLSKLSRLQISPPGSDQPQPTMRRRGATTSQLPSSGSTFANNPQGKARIHRRLKTQSLVRAKNAPIPPGEKLVAQTPILELVTPLASICTGWTPQELSVGRRLVRFSKVQDGRKLIVSCEPIRQEDYCEADAVISCIYREDVDSCFVTSVDVIYLLERLTNGEFPVEEKNRIRRNLEGLRPTTVSKHKPGFGDFFQRIMEFPDPKPRNIEKDLKVFDWNLLGQALEKILSKYSIYTSPSQVTGSTSPVSDPSPIDSPELVAIQSPFPEVAAGNVPSFVKFEPVTNEYQVLVNNPPPQDVFVSPVDSVTTASSSSSSSVLFPSCPPQAPEPLKDPQWGPGLKLPADLAQLDSLGVLGGYDALEPIETAHGFTDNPTLDFNLYDSLNFGLPNDDNVSLIEQHYVGSV